MSTIKQKTQTITLENGNRIEVRRMKWKATREFLKKVAGVLGQLYGGAGGLGGKNAQDLALDEIAKQLPELITGSDELVALLVTGSTSLTADALDDLDTADAAAIIAAALEVNLDIEVKKSFGAAAAAITALIPAPEAPTPPASQAPTK